jgi:inner membrane protein
MVEMETTISLALIIVGVILLVMEGAFPGTFLIVPGTVLLVLGFVGLLAPDLLLSWWAPLITAIILIPMTLVTIKLYQRLAPPAPPETMVASSLLGKIGEVTSDVQPGNLKGKVRIDHDIWSATSDRVILEGTRVVVRASEGVHVVVEELRS